MDVVLLFSPFVQLGFAGVCLFLLGIIVWLIKNLIALLTKNNDIIAKNTAAIHSMSEATVKGYELIRQLHDKLLQRPCIAERDR